ncbi:hypothetical protein NE619_10495 [Anaerovorax odorimutans]|uniref:Phage protein Gp138 N-terminal domain-containing protein n=1 Tax=Anaerovorax odorimutans TaxID=109327 RepID=A0ABT1RPQ3_9FIRM|nr:hypothetical protein [Anaerovorax odorimutans]MCQ4637155.1 hypothetical protein [Anaerovorax odorimutans]
MSGVEVLNTLLQGLITNPKEYDKDGWHITKYASGKMIARTCIMDTPVSGYVRRALPSDMIEVENIFATMRYNSKDGVCRCTPDIYDGDVIVYLRDATNGAAESNSTGTSVLLIGR